MSDDYIPLPQNVVRAAGGEMAADTPKLDVLIGETVVIRALEWIGQAQPYMGVRLLLHVVKGDTMTKSPAAYRAHSDAVMRVARQLAGSDAERKVILAQWPMYKVVQSGRSYALADA